MNRSRILAWSGMLLLLIIGIIHFAGVSDSYDEMPYKGVLFFLNGVGALAASVGIYRNRRTLGWGLGLAIAGSALVAYIASRTIGLPGLPAEPDAWFEPLGVATVLAEVAYVALASWILLKPTQTLQPAPRPTQVPA
jgi:hypothetical protein